MKIPAKWRQNDGKVLTLNRNRDIVILQHRKLDIRKGGSMQIEINGLHEEALLRLMQRNNEKTGAGMTRILIRDAARLAGLWHQEEQPRVISQSSNAPQQTS